MCKEKTVVDLVEQSEEILSNIDDMSPGDYADIRQAIFDLVSGLEPKPDLLSFRQIWTIIKAMIELFDVVPPTISAFLKSLMIEPKDINLADMVRQISDEAIVTEIDKMPIIARDKAALNLYASAFWTGRRSCPCNKEIIG